MDLFVCEREGIAIPKAFIFLGLLAILHSRGMDKTYYRSMCVHVCVCDIQNIGWG